jgi:hypothetical protein
MLFHHQRNGLIQLKILRIVQTPFEVIRTFVVIQMSTDIITPYKFNNYLC